MFNNNRTYLKFYTKKIKNYIIYTTSEIDIHKNHLFNKLCECLSELEITLLIFSQKRGLNFLEC